MADVDTSAWDGGQAMSDAASSDDPAAAYEAICAGRRDGDPAVQATWALPHHAHPGDPPNADGVRNSLSRLPQTDGLTNTEAAQKHLDAHLADIQAAANRASEDEVVTTSIPDGEITVRDAALREIDARLVPWDVVVESPIGLEMFARGSFSKVNPKKVVLKLGHDGDPAGRGLSIEEREDGPHMTFRVSKTQRGDELLTLVQDGVTPHVSVGYRMGSTLGEVVSQGGRRITRITGVDLDHVGTTYKPAYPSADVLAFRETQQEGEPSVPENQPAAATPTTPEVDEARVQTSQGVSLEQLRSLVTTNEVLTDRLERLEERSRKADIVIPGTNGIVEVKKSRTGDWMQTALRLMTGERVSDIQVRALSDLITSDNVGVVPDSVIAGELIGVIDPSRPFLETTRRLPTPDSGLTLTVPVIVTRPTVGVQETEKSDITSSITSITTTGFDAVTIAGGGDISIQLLKRSSPSYLDLYLRLLAEAYAIDGDALAVATLLNSGVTPGSGYIDPDDLTIGDAWTNAVSAKQRPDHIWLSTAAIQAFIDAKASGTNAPLYSNLAADITVGNGAQGRISGLIPVYVPGLDGSGADVLIGPSNGFAWAEDGTFTLQVDVPSKAGRDVAIVGILWFAPLYPSAFTSYRLAT